MNLAKFLVLTVLFSGSTALAQTTHKFELIPSFSVYKCESKADGSGTCDITAPSPADPLFVELAPCSPYLTGEVCFGMYNDKITVDSHVFEASVSITRISTAAGDVKHYVQIWTAGPGGSSASTQVTVEGNSLRDPVTTSWNALTVPGAVAGDQTFFYTNFALGVK